MEVPGAVAVLAVLTALTALAQVIQPMVVITVVALADAMFTPRLMVAALAAQFELYFQLPV